MLLVVNQIQSEFSRDHPPRSKWDIERVWCIAVGGVCPSPHSKWDSW